MATSGSTNFSMTSRDIVTAAMKKLGVLNANQSPKDAEASDALQALGLMLKSWSASEHLWIRTAATLTLVADTASYSLASVRRLESARRRTNSIDTPLQLYSRQEYDDTPNKTASGVPVAVYFDPQRSTRTLYVWPVPSAATAAATTIPYTYRRVIEDVDTLDNEPDVPQEWLECVIYNLAVRIAPDYGIGQTNPDVRDVIGFASQLLQAMKNQDQEDTSIFFAPSFQ